MKQINETTWESDNGMITFIHGDCMEFMAGCKENGFDLNVSDPPYGINADKKNSKRELKSKKSACLSKNYGSQTWDAEIPIQSIFDSIIKTSKRQIIFGANYFGLIGGMIYWHKNVTMPTFSSGELAWVSWQNKIDFFEYTWHGMIQENMKNKQERIHPTEKPIGLYRWIFTNYAKPTDTILDCFGGSMSSAIAAHMEGLRMTIIELDKEYFDKALNRFLIYEQQQTLNF